MAVNTGMQRATELVVEKTIGGVNADGYPRTYKMYEAFSNYSSTTKEAMAKMPVAEYTTRLNAFKVYIETIETGVTLDIADAYKTNLTACPIP